MKKFLFGGIALAAMAAAPAMAADMPIKAALQQPVAYYDWSGAYAGFNAGGAWYDVTHVFTTPGAITPNVTTNDRDAIFGFHAGAQWQWGAWVAGVEAALSGCFQECRSTSGVLPVAQGFEPNLFGEHKITNLFTVGPRLGYAWDRLMIFATGGWASANLKNAHCSSITNLCDGPGSTGNGASRNSGWYAGGGFDYMVHRGALVDVVLGVEYQHFDVSGSPAFCVNPGCAVAAVRDFDLSARGDLVRARLTIKTQGYGLSDTLLRSAGAAMVQRVATVAFEGIEARAVDVQVQVAPGLPAFNVVGLPDKAVSEARERVRAALVASGLALPALIGQSGALVYLTMSASITSKQGGGVPLWLRLRSYTAAAMAPGQQLRAMP